jgi:hypothetical protein
MSYRPAADVARLQVARLQAARLRSGAPSGPAAVAARLEAELHKGSGGSRGICNLITVRYNTSSKTPAST